MPNSLLVFFQHEPYIHNYKGFHWQVSQGFKATIFYKLSEMLQSETQAPMAGHSHLSVSLALIPLPRGFIPNDLSRKSLPEDLLLRRHRVLKDTLCPESVLSESTLLFSSLLHLNIINLYVSLCLHYIQGKEDEEVKH